MLTLVTGPNGSGKSLYAVRRIVEELRHGTRYIITSCVLDVAKLSEYISRKYPGERIDVQGRVWVMRTVEQMQHYWRYRGPITWSEYGSEATDLGEYGNARWQGTVTPTLYVLEELQTCFNSREWQKTAKEFTAYQTQHRHFGDDVIGVTPALSLVEKQFRLLCGECVTLRNLYQAKAGIWKHSRKIIYRTFMNAPPLPGEAPTDSGSFEIDAAGIAGCYDTSGGIGHAAGRVADKGKESKGIPWKMGIAAAAVAGIVCFFGLRAGMHKAAGYGKAKWLGRPAVAAAAPVRESKERAPGLVALDRTIAAEPGQLGPQGRIWGGTAQLEYSTNLPTVASWGGYRQKGSEFGRYLVVTTEGVSFEALQVYTVAQGLMVDGKLFRFEPANGGQWGVSLRSGRASKSNGSSSSAGREVPPSAGYGMTPPAVPVAPRSGKFL